MKALAKEEFEAWAGTYDRSLLNYFLFKPAYRMFLEELWGWRSESKEPFDLLDVGCGTGTFDAMLAASSLPARIVGLDYSPAMCKIANSKAQAAGVSDRVRYVSADSEHLPFADASFDVVTCSNSFHHYPNQAEVVKDFRRVLRPGGRLMLIDGYRDVLWGWIMFDVIVTHIEKQVYHAPWKVIRQYFADAGFQDIRRRKFNIVFPLLLTVGVA
jgi:ubiquinone/menaquinone biosynthesis C-methylase UbiE